MPKLPVLSGKDVVKLLCKIGFEHVRTAGSHAILNKQMQGGKITIPVPLHHELDFSRDFLEKVRTKRNGIHYYGAPISFDDWKSVELQFRLYFSKLKEEIKNKLQAI